ncbi:MAG: formylglycine-generating enzyme family protein [Microcystaceae cyanobacterium]
MANLEFEVALLNPEGDVIERQTHSAVYYQEKLTENLHLDMVKIPSGHFLMGSPPTEEGFLRSQSPQHEVNIDEFWISISPISQEQWKAVAKLPEINHYLPRNPAYFEGSKRPVEQVSWYEAKEFCDRLSQFSGKKYEFPSESQWEYACRANTTTPFHFGETITTKLANYSAVDWEYLGKICSKGSYGKGKQGEDRKETTLVNQFEVYNSFGLADMHGNVREWCADAWHPNYNNAPTDDQPWLTNGDLQKRVIRGGSWNGSPHKCRSAYRAKFEAEGSLYDIGFRVIVPSNNFET